MAKRQPYSISPDDPDIVWVKENHPEIFSILFNTRFDLLPGKEENTWNSLNELAGETFREYIAHCKEHCGFLLGRWSAPNKIKIEDFLVALKDANFSGNVAIKNTAWKIIELGVELNHLPEAMSVFGFSFSARGDVFTKHLNQLTKDLLNSFVEISNDCESADLFNKLIDTESQALVKKHHFLASQAKSFAELADQWEMHAAGTGICFLPITFKLLQQAIIWQQEGSVEIKNEEGSEQKRRKLYSPDSFQFKDVSVGQNSQLFRSITRDFFIKAWLFKLIESKISSTGKPLSKQALINEMSKRIPECATMPPKTLENLLTNLKETGYVSARLDMFLE
ncbi:hypothetical protein [Aeromonas rivipollensis]|uniref:hypothetical protein n=1 Tax=Aeromonas rivipollensis TaxID=948519 RepID=UPI003D1B3C4F